MRVKIIKLQEDNERCPTFTFISGSGNSVPCCWYWFTHKHDVNRRSPTRSLHFKCHFNIDLTLDFLGCGSLLFGWDSHLFIFLSHL